MASWFEAFFAFLFKYRPAVFAKGDLAFGAPASVIILLALAVLVAAPAVLTYAGVRGKSSRRDRWVLGALRVATLLVLVVCLFRPMLLVSEALPQRNYVGVLIDCSRSMQITDRDNKPRSDVAARLFGGPDSSAAKQLREKFQLRYFCFGESSNRVDDAKALTYKEPSTHLVSAIERARQELEAVPISGMVVVTDGADNSQAALADQLAALRARGLPIFPIGVGTEHFDRDIEIRRVEATRTVIKGTSLTADVLIKQRGYGGQRVVVAVDDNGRMIAQDTVTLPNDGDIVPVRIHVKLATAGSRVLTFRIPLQNKEQVTQNNQIQTLVTVRDTRERILYMEGEPRYEFAFIRRAIAADSNLEIVALMRTADEPRFWRGGVEDSTELAAGFPRTRDELFQYRSIVLGSVEASFFTHDQLQMIADFVSIRGGGVLFLGGRKAFSEGGYAGTPIADVMPVVLDGEAVLDSMTLIADLRPEVTPAGASHSVTQIGATPEKSARRWRDSLPIVTSVNYIRNVKPGAVTLIKGVVPGEGRAELPNGSVSDYEQPILVYQRFGRGISIALPVQDTYHWQMDPNPNAAENDATFETFWRQLLRWLVTDVPGRVSLSMPSDQINPGGAITVRAQVVDSMFIPRNDAIVVARVKSTNGTTKDIPMDWAVDRDGEYRASFTPPDSGIHSIVVNASHKDGAAVRDSIVFRVADLNTEWVDAEMRAPLLKRIADETGGRYYTPDKVSTLAEDLALSKHGVTVVNQMDLWDMPFNFLLLVLLVSAEWGYRKVRGLA